MISHDCCTENCEWTPDKERGKETTVIHSNLCPWRGSSPLSVKRWVKTLNSGGWEKRETGEWRQKDERNHKVSQRGMICGSWLCGFPWICLFLFITHMTWPDWLLQPDSAVTDWMDGWLIDWLTDGWMTDPVSVWLYSGWMDDDDGWWIAECSGMHGLMDDEEVKVWTTASVNGPIDGVGLVSTGI